MGINITEKTDYSYLFNSLNSSNSSSNAFSGLNLSDYASIKNGSYGRLLKAYYAKQDADSTTKTDKKKDETNSTEVKKLTAVQTNATALQDSASKLINKGNDSLFREKELTTKNSDGTTTTTTGYDKDAIYSAVSDFTTKYNAFIKAADNTSSSSVERQNKNLISLVSSNKTSLNNVGITINEDNTLKIDETKFKAADMTKVKSLFNGNTSFAYSVATKVSLIGTNAASEANTAKNYTSTGNYTDTYSAGNLLNSIV